MEMRTKDDPLAVFERLVQAQNAHDLEAMLACFDPGYRSEQPAHPARTFTGTDQVRKNWAALLTAIRDFRADVLRTAVKGDTLWAEAHWSGTKADGSPLHEMIVTIFGLRDGRIVWGRLYGEEVEREGSDIDETVRRISGTGGDVPSRD
ncbi:MAG: nuclear transport factor 2 family protein [Chloroflexota bacterium]